MARLFFLVVAILLVAQCPYARTQLVQQVTVTHNPDHVHVEIAKTTLVYGESDDQSLCAAGPFYNTRHTFEVLAKARDGCAQISVDQPDGALIRNGGTDPSLDITIDPLACRENGAECVFLVTIVAQGLSCEQLHNQDGARVVIHVGAHVSEVCAEAHPTDNAQHHMLMRVEFGFPEEAHQGHVMAFRKRQVATTTTTYSTTDSGSPASSTVSSLTVSPVSSNTTPSVASAQPAPAYSVSVDTSSVSVSPIPSLTSDPDEFAVPEDKLFERSSVEADTVFKPVENSSSTDHVAIEQTQYKHQYVMDHSHRVPESVISRLASQAEQFTDVPRSDILKLDEANFHDDEDSSAVIGGQFAFQNVQCIRSNGTTFAIPNVPCQRVEGHPNLCYPICAQKWQPYCTPQCFCRDNFGTNTYTDAAIINCTKGYFPQPTRAPELDTWGILLALLFVPLPILSPFLLWALLTLDKIYDVPMPWDALAARLNINVS